jgi:signal transduction histidine kinase
MKKALAGSRVKHEVSYPQADGSQKWYCVRMFPISREDNNDIYGLMMEVSDITQDKLHEEELLRQKEQEHKNIVRAVINAQEVERNRLGQELHDNVNQILSTIKIYLSLVGQQCPGGNDLIDKTKEFINTAINEIRSLSADQVTPEKEFDLRELIEDLTGHLNDNSGTGTKFRCDVPRHMRINEDIKLNIYRIVQEQINNILKHADASDAAISIWQTNGEVNVLITDNGKGFDTGAKRKGIGISNIINRIESYNGRIAIESSVGRGCKLDITIPFL